MTENCWLDAHPILQISGALGFFVEKDRVSPFYWHFIAQTNHQWSVTDSAALLLCK